MKSTGITRRIDDLGRIVIPKEIRKNLRLKDGELLEIFINDEDIVLKKFSKMNDMEKIFDDYVNVLNSLTGSTILITDTEKIISSSKQQYINKQISEELEDFLERRTSIYSKDAKDINILNDIKEKYNYYIVPIIVNSDSCGLLIMLSKRQISEEDKLTLDVMNRIITKYME